MNRIFFLTVFLIFGGSIKQTYCQTGGSTLRGPSPGELIAESLFQAVSLEKLPEVSVLFNSDTIFIAAYDLFSDTSSEIEISTFLSNELPSHVDKWWVKTVTEIVLNERDDEFYYLKLFIDREEYYYTIDIICQPNNDEFIDRGRLTLTYEYKNGLLVLQKLVRWYG